MKKLIMVVLVVSSLAMTSVSFSQITGSINAKGTVLTRISITSTSDLNFGTTILPGVSVTVDKANASAGQFSLSGQANKQINVTLTLPTTLVSGSNNMPITFTSTDGAYKTPAGTMTAFNPASATNVSFASEGTMIIYLGGKITPAHTQAAGSYTAPVQISLYYTGN